MIDDFNDWLAEQPHPHKVITCGNHEFIVEADTDTWRRRLSNASVLLNEAAVINGVRFFGSPTTPLWSGAFGRSSERDREEIFATIPADTQILISHSPPYGILDGGQGCGALRRAVVRVKPRLHVFGHVHSAYGTRPTANTMFCNAASLDGDGAPTQDPIVLDVKF
jgi:Icc-related predicted phosphoesterase